MEFSLSQGQLSAAIARVINATDRRSPMLGSILITACAGEVSLTATDMRVGVTEVIACDVVSGGALAIQAGHLANVVKVLSGEVSVKSLHNSWARIAAGRTEYKVMGIGAGDFPDLPDPTGVNLIDVDAPTIVDLIDKTLFS